MLRPADTLIRDKTGRSNFTLTSALVDLTTASETPAPMPMFTVDIGPGFPAITQRGMIMYDDLHTPLTEVELQDYEAEFHASAESQRNQLMDELRQKGKVVAPIGGPAWLGAVDCVSGFNWLAEEITRPVTIINRWRMAGGQLRTATRFKLAYLGEHGSILPDSLRLEVLVRDSSRWIVKAKGTVEDWRCEMNAEIAAFDRGTDQRIADEVAELLVRIRDSENQAERVALMALRSRCHSCNRPLKDEISKIIGFGPDCAKQSGIPHSLEFARQVERYRAEQSH